MTSLASSAPSGVAQFLALPGEPKPGSRAYVVGWLAWATQGERRAHLRAEAAKTRCGKASTTYHRLADEADSWAETVHIWRAELAKLECRATVSA